MSTSLQEWRDGEGEEKNGYLFILLFVLCSFRKGNIYGRGVGEGQIFLFPQALREVVSWGAVPFMEVNSRSMSSRVQSGFGQHSHQLPSTFTEYQIDTRHLFFLKQNKHKQKQNKTNKKVGFIILFTSKEIKY